MRCVEGICLLTCFPLKYRDLSVKITVKIRLSLFVKKRHFMNSLLAKRFNM